MKAAVTIANGDFESLSYVPIPDLADTEVLIRVLACGLNNTDITQVYGTILITGRMAMFHCISLDSRIGLLWCRCQNRGPGCSDDARASSVNR